MVRLWLLYRFKAMLSNEYIINCVSEWLVYSSKLSNQKRLHHFVCTAFVFSDFFFFWVHVAQSSVVSCDKLASAARWHIKAGWSLLTFPELKMNYSVPTTLPKQLWKTLFIISERAKSPFFSWCLHLQKQRHRWNNKAKGQPCLWKDTDAQVSGHSKFTRRQQGETFSLYLWYITFPFVFLPPFLVVVYKGLYTLFV